MSHTLTNSEAVSVSERAREVAAGVWRDFLAKIGECIAEKQIRAGALDRTPFVQAFARFERDILSTPPAAGQSDSGLVEALRHAIDRDRYIVAAVMGRIKKAVACRQWLSEGRGPYEWDDDRYRDEFSDAVRAIAAAAAPLAKVAWDKTLCTTEPDKIAAARNAAYEALGRPLGPQEMRAADAMLAAFKETGNERKRAHD